MSMKLPPLGSDGYQRASHERISNERTSNKSNSERTSAETPKNDQTELVQRTKRILTNLGAQDFAKFRSLNQQEKVRVITSLEKAEKNLEDPSIKKEVQQFLTATKSSVTAYATLPPPPAPGAPPSLPKHISQARLREQSTTEYTSALINKNTARPQPIPSAKDLLADDEPVAVTHKEIYGKLHFLEVNQKKLSAVKFKEIANEIIDDLIENPFADKSDFPKILAYRPSKNELLRKPLDERIAAAEKELVKMSASGKKTRDDIGKMFRLKSILNTLQLLRVS